jgi:hypothetical protein
MDFALFILLNAILLIRPEDLWPELEGMRLYQIVICVSLIISLPRIIEHIRPNELKRQPITVCVLGLLVALVLSLVVHGYWDDLEDLVTEFVKVIAFYLLLVSVVNTPGRLRVYLASQVVFTAFVAGLGLLQFHDFVDIESIKPVLDRRVDAETGSVTEVLRLCSSGVFNDPNDLCLILVFGIVCCLYLLGTAESRLSGWIWLSPIPLFGYALFQTGSRGGLLSLMFAVAVLLWTKFGSRRSLPLILLLPVGLMLAGGRQSQIGGDTAHERVMIWADGLTELLNQKSYLLTGLGAGKYIDEISGQVAHNSFVHAYVEMGLIGGGFFLGAFGLALWMTLSLKKADPAEVPPFVRDSLPYMASLLAGYIGGMYSLSRCYHVPTYICLGVATSYLTMAMPELPERFQVTRNWWLRLAMLSVGGLAFLKLFTQVAGAVGM